MKDDISQNDVLRLVIRLSLENAERFLDDAMLLINNSSFGHAFALTTLALEETGKAIYCEWAMNGFVNVNDNFFKNLRTHKTKQKVIREIKKLIILKTEIDKYRKSKNRRKNPFKSSLELDLFLTKLENSAQFKSVDAFYGELENMKHFALYVDVGKDGVPSDPSVFTKNVCDLYLTFVQTIFISAKNDLLFKNKD